MVVRMKRCPTCGLTSPRDAARCPGCRTEFAYRASREAVEPTQLPSRARWVAPAPHDISIAALASIFLAGMGQVYNGQNLKGFAFMLVSAALLIVACIGWALPLATLTAMLWVLSILDATTIARRLIEGERVRPWQWF